MLGVQYSALLMYKLIEVELKKKKIQSELFVLKDWSENKNETFVWKVLFKYIFLNGQSNFSCYPTMICFKFYKLKLTIYGMCKQLKRCIGDMKEKALPNFLQTLTSFNPFYFCQEVAVPSTMTAFWNLLQHLIFERAVIQSRVRKQTVFNMTEY